MLCKRTFFRRTNITFILQFVNGMSNNSKYFFPLFLLSNSVFKALFSVDLCREFHHFFKRSVLRALGGFSTGRYFQLCRLLSLSQNTHPHLFSTCRSFFVCPALQEILLTETAKTVATPVSGYLYRLKVPTRAAGSCSSMSVPLERPQKSVILSQTASQQSSIPMLTKKSTPTNRETAT